LTFIATYKPSRHTLRYGHSGVVSLWLRYLLANFHNSLPYLRSPSSIAAKEWKIWVKDNGMGIPVEHQQNIFDILYRLHGSDYDGAGIGLATCKWIVQNHFGTIGVESQVGEGSCFYFTLRSADKIPTID
jgi:signal transduction histidine kinase